MRRTGRGKQEGSSNFALLLNLVLLVLLLAAASGRLFFASSLLVDDELCVTFIPVPLEACEVGVLA